VNTDLHVIGLPKHKWVDIMILLDVHADDCQIRATAFPPLAGFYEALRDSARELSDDINQGLSPLRRATAIDCGCPRSTMGLH
jgi:hypothetical protein